MSMETKDLAQENINKLTKLFTELITEVERGGSVVKTVNVEILRNLVGDFAHDSDEVYELTWVGKQESRQKIVTPINKTLRPVPEDSVDFENTENLYIEGDNFEVLKLLQESYLNKIKMIYIDPPYNTGKDFVYKDNFAMSKEEYDDETGAIDEEGNRLFMNTTTNGRFHSDWLSMMFERLVIAKDLLRDDGVIFISIDDNEVANLRKICDEVFGEQNFVSQFVWKGRAGAEDDDKYRRVHEYILVYSKESTEYDSGLEPKIDESFPKYDEVKKRNYKTQLLRKWGDNSRREDRPNLYYAIKDSNGNPFYPKLPDGSDGCWRWDPKRMEQEIIEDNVEFGINKDGFLKAYEKKYKPKEGEFNYKKFNTWLSEDGSSSTGTKECKSLFNNKKIFDRPKPVTLLSKLISMADIKEEHIIMDFFSGSATTAHTVMQLNAEDGGNRKFIMVQLQEPTAEDSEAFKAGYKNIAEIGKERIRRAARKIQEENTDKDLSNIDFGFRVFKLDSSNMKDIYYNPKDIDQRTLTNFRDNIKENRTDKDLLYQVLLEMAVPISAKIKEETVNNKTIYRINDDFLVACFDDDVDLETIKEISEFKPLRFVFKDSSFKDDAAKVNCDEYLKNKLPNTIVKVI